MGNKTPNLILSSAFLAFVCLFSVLSISAETISGYRARIHRVKLSVDSLFGDDEGESGSIKKAFAKRETLKQIRLALPASERIESKSSSIETQNKWFSEKLNAYEKETDSEKQGAILSEISERLGAIEAEVTQLENAANVARSKDEDKRKLTEILSREEYQKPEPPKESVLQKLWRKIKEWLNGVFPETSPFSVPEGGLSSLSFLIQIIVYALVLGGIGFLIYKFSPFVRARFKRNRKEKRSERVVLGETLAADTDSHTLFAEAESLAREGELRAAIRKGYVALLCDLSDRKIIGLAKNKTNRDYLRDVRPREEIFDNMKNLTTNFERNWYGVGATEEKDWDEFKEKYRQVIKS